MSQFFMSSDGEVFVDLAEVCAYLRHEDENGPYVSVFLRGKPKELDLGGDYTSEFTDALQKYRHLCPSGTPL